jgi:hypothetical protein
MNDFKNKKFPLLRKKFLPQDADPIRRGIDYQSTAKPTFLVHSCPECGRPYVDEHPDNGCVYADVINTMNS